MTHPMNFQKAMARVVLDHPFFASLLLRLHIRQEPRIDTIGVNNREMVYNPEFVASKSVDDMVFILCHEVMHLAMCHPMRRGHRDHKKANVAGDYAINAILKDCDLPMPDDALYSDVYRTNDGKVLAMEQIYDALPDSNDGGGDDNGEGEGGEGDESGEGAGGGQGQGQGNGQGQDDGSAPNVQDPAGHGGFFDAEDQQGETLSQAEMAQEEAEMGVAIQQAAQAAKLCGKLPQSLDALVESMANPVMDWREVLREFIQKTARDGYRWDKPNRRHIANGLYLPSRQSDELRPIAVYFDNSGSVSNEELAEFGAELNDILGNSYPCTVYVTEFDTEITDNVKVYTHEDYPIDLQRTKCGGTDFTPVFDHVEELAQREGQEFACCLVMTDMCAPMPTNEPHCPVLWASSYHDHATPNFGEVCYTRPK